MNEQVLTAFKVQTQKSKEKSESFQVVYEILSAFNIETMDPRKKEIAEKVAEIDAKADELQSKIDSLNTEIERLTNHADGIDYTIAVASGVLCGLIDSFVIGEFDFKKDKAKSNRQVNNFITKFANMQGFKGDRLDGAISFLEKKYPVAQDNIWKGKDFGVSATNHHLDDLAHHPTLVGLAASIVVQFFRMGVFVNKDGEWKFEFISTEPKELLKIWMPVIISGLLMWMVHIVESKYEDKIDENIPKPIQQLIKALAAAPMVIPVLKVAANWAGHLVSDMGGSKNTAGGGMGISGLFLSLLHEMSSLPILKNTELPKLVNDLYVTEKFDMRSELAVINELGRQAIPVLIGEVLVRGFYFVRRLVQEISDNGNFKDVNWKNVIPFNNRTIVRMMSIESGTFTAIDLADAAIRAAIKSGPPTTPLFWKDFILRVNFVGVGRFAIAIGTDVSMGINRSKNINDRIKIVSEQIKLSNAKLFYKQANYWIELKNTEQAINELFVTAEQSGVYFSQSFFVIEQDMKEIYSIITNVKSNNKTLLEEIGDML